MKYSSEPHITEVGVRVIALEKMAVKNGNIMKKSSKGGRKKNIEELLGRMIEWEAEEGYGDESVELFDYSKL